MTNKLRTAAATPHRTLQVLRALWVIAHEPVLDDMQVSIEHFAARLIGSVESGDAEALRQVRNDALDWARRNRYRLSLTIEESMGGDSQ